MEQDFYVVLFILRCGIVGQWVFDSRVIYSREAEDFTNSPQASMNTDELRNLMELLAARREQLIREGDVKLEPNRKDAASVPDEDEQPLNEMNQIIASKRNRARAIELQRIHGALARLAQNPDDFGFCAECDDPIAGKRLELMPWALYCVRCQAEKGQAHGGRRRHLRDFSD